jgi:hypothetical protein
MAFSSDHICTPAPDPERELPATRASVPSRGSLTATAL